MQTKKETQDVKKILRDAGLKSTAPRLAVLRTLSELKYPATVQEIRTKLGKTATDLVTLYRTLASFEKNQLIKRVDVRKDAVHYELCTGHHHHIICADCGMLEDFELCDMDRLTEKLSRNRQTSKECRNIALNFLEFVIRV